MWDADKDDDAAFEHRLDNVVREIGDRGKVLLPEAVTPLREPTPAPVPAPTPAQVLVSAPAPAPTVGPVTPAAPVRSTPPAPAATNLESLEHAPRSTSILQPQPYSGQLMTQTLGSNGSFDAMTMSFISEQQDKLVALLREERREERTVAEAKMEQQRQEAKAEVAEFRRELEKQREESEAATRAWHRDQQVAVLQARLETLHGLSLIHI